MITSGIRLGTAALTSRGFKEPDFEQTARWINDLISNRNNEIKIQEIRTEINKFMERFPLYPEIQIN